MCSSLGRMCGSQEMCSFPGICSFQKNA
jgi:hypothetical protein